MSQCYSKLN